MGLPWEGPSAHTLKREHNVWPDFHHDRNLMGSGSAVSFLPREAADLFSLWGTADQITVQLISTLKAAPVSFDYLILQPIPDPSFPDAGAAGYTERMAREVLPRVREALQTVENYR